MLSTCPNTVIHTISLTISNIFWLIFHETDFITASAVAFYDRNKTYFLKGISLYHPSTFHFFLKEHSVFIAASQQVV